MQCPCTISASHNLCVSYYLNLHCASYIDHGRSEDDSPKTVSYQLNTILFTEWKFLLKINKLRLGFLEMQVKTSNMKKNQLFQFSWHHCQAWVYAWPFNLGILKCFQNKSQQHKWMRMNFGCGRYFPEVTTFSCTKVDPLMESSKYFNKSN